MNLLQPTDMPIQPKLCGAPTVYSIAVVINSQLNVTYVVVVK